MSIPVKRKASVPDPTFSKALEPLVNLGTWLRQEPFLPMRSLAASPTPAMDIRETPKAFSLRLDVPGFTIADLEVGLSGHRLSLSGKRPPDPREEGETFLVRERALADFHRTVTLPEGVDATQVHAELKDGVLSVTAPKLLEARSRKISISTP